MEHLSGSGGSAVYGWKGQEGLTLSRPAGAAASTACVVELMTEVAPKVWLGVRAAAEDAVALGTAGIEAVISAGSEPQPLATDVMVKKAVKLGDLEKAALLGALPKVFDSIDTGVEEGGVLIHSEEADADESAATAVVVGWLMARQGVAWPEALPKLKAERPSAALNANFEKQLRVWTTWKEFPGLPEWM
jgi:hypothetical protein